MIALAITIIALVCFVVIAVRRSRRHDMAINVCFQTGLYHVWRCDGQRGNRMHYHCIDCGQKAWFKMNYDNPIPPPFFDQSNRFHYSSDWSEDDAN